MKFAKEGQSLKIARQFIGKDIEIVVDRPLGSRHPEFGFVYEANYGYAEGVKAPDGENLDAYFLGGDGPLKMAKGKVVAVIHRLDDDDDKLVVVADGDLGDGEIRKMVDFQEKWFEYEILRG